MEKMISYCYCVTIFVLMLCHSPKGTQLTARHQSLLYVFHLAFDKELLGRFQLKTSTCFRLSFFHFLCCCLKDLLANQDFPGTLTLSVLLTNYIT